MIDPARDIEPYLKVAEENKMQIVAAAETHIHADFISGARELAERVGAKLYLSDEGDADWKYTYLEGSDYDYQLVYDKDTFKVGNVTFEVFHSPGHTPEHISFLLTDANADEPMGIFTGDFVFVGDIGRPDLLEEAAGMMGTAEPGARRMFHSIERFKQLPDYIQVWPAHGAGSACGKSLGAVPTTTVGYEKLFSPLLGYNQEDDFIKDLLSGQPEAPFYFAQMKKLNKVGPKVLNGLPLPPRVTIHRLEAALERGETVIDTRSKEEFATAHIPGTINVPLDGQFTDWAGWFLDYDEPFHLIVDGENVEEAIRDLTYIGIDNAASYVETSVIDSWQAKNKPLQSYMQLTPSEAAEKVKQGAVNVLDVRNKLDWQEGHIPGSSHIMLGHLLRKIENVPTDKPLLVNCTGGHRSAIASSVLQAKGVENVISLVGGYRDWAEAGLPISRNGH